MNTISGGEIALMATLAGVIVVALIAVVATAVAGMGRLPGQPDDGRTDHLAMRSTASRRDRTTPILLIASFVGLNALTTGLLLWGDGLDVWAYVVVAAGLLLTWLLALVTIHHKRAAPEA